VPTHEGNVRGTVAALNCQLVSITTAAEALSATISAINKKVIFFIFFKIK